MFHIRVDGGDDLMKPESDRYTNKKAVPKDGFLAITAVSA